MSIRLLGNPYRVHRSGRLERGESKLPGAGEWVVSGRRPDGEEILLHRFFTEGEAIGFANKCSQNPEIEGFSNFIARPVNASRDLSADESREEEKCCTCQTTPVDPDAVHQFMLSYQGIYSKPPSAGQIAANLGVVEWRVCYAIQKLGREGLAVKGNLRRGKWWAVEKPQDER